MYIFSTKSVEVFFRINHPFFSVTEEISIRMWIGGEPSLVEKVTFMKL